MATIEDSNNKRKLEETSETNGDTKKPNLETSFVTGIPLTTMPGHTGYLTFATLKPDLSQSINWFCDLFFKIVYFAEVKDEIEKRKLCAAEYNAKSFSTFSVKIWICYTLILTQILTNLFIIFSKQVLFQLHTFIQHHNVIHNYLLINVQDTKLSIENK